MNTGFFHLGTTLLMWALFGLLSPAYGQQDTEFWFAAPDASATHEDSPIRLRLSTENLPATVSITMPANPSFTPINITIPANSTRTVNLASQKSLLEHSESGVVVNKGLRITSSAMITAYYEVGQTFNIDIYTLKGKNALGQDFIAPGQTVWSNVNFTDARSTIELVATTNNTIVTMVPNADIVGHSAGDTVIVRLNRGQSYSLRRTSRIANETLAGTVIQSSKPIAVGVSDDSIQEGQCYDLAGDQIVPVGIVGQEYIVSRGQINNSEYIFITGTEDGTILNIRGQGQIADTIGYRETKRYVTEDVMHIKSSRPVYLMQYTGIGCELGAALIPSVNCKGSNTISFTRSGNEEFYLKLLVRDGGQTEFTVNGNGSMINPGDFSTVPGSGGAWKIAVIGFSTAAIIPGNVYVVKNETNSFQLGFLDGGVVTGSRYGYFSNFSSLFIGDDLTLCEGDTWEIVPKGQPGSTYVWNDGSTEESLFVDSPGTYWVEMTNPTGCVLRDSLVVTEKTKDFLQLPDTLYGCEGELFSYTHGRYADYQWSNGQTSRTFTAEDPGNYSLIAVDRHGCEDSDSMQVLFHPQPVFSVIDSVRICEGDSILVNAETTEVLQFNWSNGDQSSDTHISEGGWFWVEGSNEHCADIDSLWSEQLYKPPSDTILGSKSVCPGVENVLYYVDHPTDELITTWWNVNGGTIDSQDDFDIEVDWSDANDQALVQFVSISADNCPSDTASFEVTINEILDTETPNGTTDVCFNDAQQVYQIMPTNGSVYDWQVENGAIVAGQGTSEIMVEWQQTGTHELVVLETSITDVTTCFGTSDPLNVTVFLDSASISLNYVTVSPAQDNSIEINWLTQNPHRLEFPLSLYRRDGFNAEWAKIADVETNDDLIDQPVNTTVISYGYQLRGFNFCQEELTTNIHQSVVLAGSSNEDETVISLSWNEYEGWNSGVERYYVIRQLDGNTSYDTIAAVGGTTNQVELQNATDGFQHRIRVVAERQDGTVSLSNHVEFEFTHELDIPNVITPNADQLNDFFVIPKIELFPQARLTIYNRQAAKVFSTKGYQNNFSGTDLSAGTYYYHLSIPNLDREYKGWLSVLK